MSLISHTVKVTKSKECHTSRQSAREAISGGFISPEDHTSAAGIDYDTSICSQSSFFHRMAIYLRRVDKWDI